MNQLDLKLVEEGLIELELDFNRLTEKTTFTDKGVKEVADIIKDPYYKKELIELVKSSKLPKEEIKRRLRILNDE